MKNVIHNWKLGMLALCAAIILPAISGAQTRTEVKELKRFAAKSEKAFLSLRKETESKAKLLGLPMRETINGVYREIYRFINGVPVYRQTDNLGCAQTVGTYKLWPGGLLGLSLTGSGWVLGEWDGGVALESHQEYTGRINNKDGGAEHYHSTHVAGTMIATGIDSKAKGMSFESVINGYDWDNDSAEMALEAADGLLLSNHSYSWVSISQFGMYWEAEADRDSIAYNAPFYLICQSAGNYQEFSSTGTGYDTLSNPANAKNILTVGAVYKNTYLSPSSVKMSDFSSWGPTDDGRIKPDLVAPGVNVYSTYDTNDTSYEYLDGTSMATPCTTGSLGLIVQYYDLLFPGQKMRSATLKALAIHTTDEAGTADGPDYMFGWGQLNVASAALTLQELVKNPSTIQEGVLNEGESFEYVATADGLAPIRVTIVWTDPAGTPTYVTDDPTPMLVNDLDLRVEAGGNTYQPWVLDPTNRSAAATRGDNTLDNVEQVIVPATAGQCKIIVSHKGSSLSPSGTQAFSLIVTGLSSPKLQGLTLKSNRIASSTSTTGTVTLDGTAPAGGLTISLSSSDHSIARVPATVKILAGSQTGTFTIKGMKVTEAQTATITATQGDLSFSEDITVAPPGLIRLELDSDSVDGGSSVNGEVEIGLPAPAGGVVVRVATDNKKVADVAWAVNIAEGETVGTFTITTYPVTKVTAVRVRAAYPGPTKYITLTVNPPFALSALALSKSSIKGGQTVTGTITMAKAASVDTVVTLASSMPSVASVPASVTVLAGQSTATFTVTTNTVTSTKNPVISATYNSLTKTAKLKVTK